MKALQNLEGRISRATGSDTGLDHAIRDVLDPDCPDDSAPAYTASVDACIALIGKTLPDWHWHVGHGPTGILPYASLTHDTANPAILFDVTASTVPLALLGALMKAAKSDRSAATKP